MDFFGFCSKIISCLGSKSSLILCLTSFSGAAAYTLILGVLFFCGLGIPIPEDITLLTAGILVALGKISFHGAIITGLIGVMMGDSLLFFLGRRMGKKIFDVPILRSLVTRRKIRRAERRILANSKFICFVARFLPGLRSPIFLTAGVMGIRPIIFLGLDGLAALISVPFWIYVGWWVGENWDSHIETFKRLQIYILLGILTVILGYFVLKKRISK